MADIRIPRRHRQERRDLDPTQEGDWAVEVRMLYCFSEANLIIYNEWLFDQSNLVRELHSRSHSEANVVEWGRG